MTAVRRSALVIGGSISGLYAARLLARQGWTVSVFERVRGDLRSRGAGIAMHPETFAMLRHVGIDLGADFGVVVRRRRVLDRSGNVVHDVTRPQVTASWASLYAMLRDGLDGVSLHAGKTLIGIDRRPGAILARFDDGSEVAGDVLVGADGLHSTVRRWIAPSMKPHYTGYLAWRGMAIQARLGDRTRERVFPEFCFCLPPGEQMAGYPVREVADLDGAPALSYNLIWYRPVPATCLDAYMTDANGNRHETNVPPPLTRPQIVAEMRRAAEATLSPEFIDLLGAVAEPFYQPIYEMAMPTMVGERVALVGDAAFVARPHVGAGVTKGFQDGEALARHLTGTSIEAALAGYDAERLPLGARIVERGRELGRVMGSCELDDHARTLEMMLGSATLDFLT